MGLPSGIATIQVTGQNLCDLEGNPAVSGYVYFKASGKLADPTHNVVISNFYNVAAVTNGVMYPTTMPVNDETVNPNGFTVNIRSELFYNDPVTGVLRKTPIVDEFDCSLPHTLGPTVDIADLTPVSSFTPINGVTIIGTGTAGQVLTSLGNQTADWANPAGGIQPPAGDLGGSQSNPTVLSTHLTNPLPLNQGGTAASTAAGARTSLGLGGSAVLNVGTTTGTVAAGDDSRITGALQSANNLSDVPNPATGRSSLGLGNSATRNVGATAGTVAAGDDSRITGALQSAGTGLTQVGTTVSLTVPVSPTNLPQATTTSFGTVEFDSSATDLQPIGDIPAAGSVGKVPDVGHVHPLQPWQFSVLKYGATGNLNCVVDAVTNGTAVVTSASGKFTSGMVNQSVAIKGGLTSGQTTLRTTVASYQSPTQVTLNAVATSSATGLQMVWGNDDTAAFQAAQNAAVVYGNGSPFSKVTQVVIPQAPGGFGYMIDGNLTSTDGTNAVYNGQIVTGIRSDRLPPMILEWISPGDSGFPRHWNQDYPHFNGCSLFSTLTFSSQAAQATSDTHSIANQGNPAILSGPTGKNGYGVTATNPVFNNMTIVLTNISMINAHSSSGWSICPFNFHGMARAHLRRCSFGTSGVVQYYTGGGGSGGNTDFANPATFSGGASLGGLMPAAGNNASNVVEDCVWNGGFTYGPLLTEHTVCKGVNTSLYNWIGIGVAGNYGDGGTGAGSLHAIDLGQFCVEACSYHLGVWGTGASGIGPYVKGTLDTEGTVQVRGVTNVAANLKALSGEIHLTGSPSTPTFTFGTNLRLIKETQVRGAVAAPSFSLGTAQINTFYRDMLLTVSGGTVTAVKVSDLAGGTSAERTMTTQQGTSGTFLVPAGCWWEIDGSVAPTLSCVLL